MTAAETQAAILMAFLLLGLVAGAGFFLSLRRIVVHYLEPNRPWRPLLLQGFRLLLLGGLFWFAAVHGAAALLCMLGGFLIARVAIVRSAPRSL